MRKITKSQIKQIIKEFLPPKSTSAPRPRPTKSPREAIKDIMISHMIYRHDHGTPLSYWNASELIADLESELKLSEQDWLEQAEQNNPRAIRDLFNEALLQAQEEVDAAWE